MTTRDKGGSFAPPIDEAKLTAYAALAETATPRVKSAMNDLIKMVGTWYALPESTGPATVHPATPNPNGRQMHVVALDPAHVATLDEHVPFADELPAIAAAFEDLDREAALRNGSAIDLWQQKMRLAIIDKYFPAPTLFAKLNAAMRTAAEWIGLLASSEQARLKAEFAKVSACRAAIAAAMQTKQCEGVPYPTLEPTPVRDAAHHLLWFATELTQDREPQTSDKLK